MAVRSNDKRRRLVEAAADLTHRRGLSRVALADIAKSAGVPLGNVYYYFKTKADITEAIVEQRRAEFQQLRAIWEKSPSPRERLKAFVRMTVSNRESLARSGCPVGSLCSELGKERDAVSDGAAMPLRELLLWIQTQFAAIGRATDKEPFAIHLLSALQGASLLTNCFHDPKIILREGRQLDAWIDGL